MPFLAKCSCSGTTCQCSHLDTDQPINIQASEDSPMNELTKISDLLAGLAPQQRERVIADLPPKTQKILADELAAAAKTSNRVDVMLAAAYCQRDLMVEKVTGELRRLGLTDGTMKASAKKYTVHQIDQAMKSAGWLATHRMAFKCELAALGLLAD
jgi:hypothetical protein